VINTVLGAIGEGALRLSNRERSTWRLRIAQPEPEVRTRKRTRTEWKSRRWKGLTTTLTNQREDLGLGSVTALWECVAGTYDLCLSNSVFHVNTQSSSSAPETVYQRTQ